MTFVPDPERRLEGVESFARHQPPRLLEPQPLLLLERAEGRHVLEVEVERRRAAKVNGVLQSTGRNSWIIEADDILHFIGSQKSTEEVKSLAKKCASMGEVTKVEPRPVPGFCI